jgi:hypothetical protein
MNTLTSIPDDVKATFGTGFRQMKLFVSLKNLEAVKCQIYQNKGNGWNAIRLASGPSENKLLGRDKRAHHERLNRRTCPVIRLIRSWLQGNTQTVEQSPKQVASVTLSREASAEEAAKLLTEAGTKSKRV